MNRNIFRTRKGDWALPFAIRARRLRTEVITVVSEYDQIVLRHAP